MIKYRRDFYETECRRDEIRAAVKSSVRAVRPRTLTLAAFAALYFRFGWLLLDRSVINGNHGIFSSLGRARGEQGASGAASQAERYKIGAERGYSRSARSDSHIVCAIVRIFCEIPRKSGETAFKR